jgi:hypothetical protein
METIEQNGPICKIRTSMRQLDFTVSASYLIDGKDRTKGDVTSNAHWEGHTLVIDNKKKTSARIITVHESLTLSDDGKSMTKNARSNAWGIMETSKIVFDRISATSRMNDFAKGSTMAEVKGAWGDPDEVLGAAPNITFVYFNWRCGRFRVCRRSVTFVDEKVTEIQ